MTRTSECGGRAVAEGNGPNVEKRAAQRIAYCALGVRFVWYRELPIDRGISGR
jgi:hypothetical protein